MRRCGAPAESTTLKYEGAWLVCKQAPVLTVVRVVTVTRELLIRCVPPHDHRPQTRPAAPPPAPPPNPAPRPPIRTGTDEQLAAAEAAHQSNPERADMIARVRRFKA